MEGARRGGGWYGTHVGVIPFSSILQLPLLPLNTLFLAKGTCQVKGTENIFVPSGLFVTAV